MVEGQDQGHDRGSRAGERSRLGGHGREQGWGQVRGRVKVRGSREGVMVGALGIGARGAVGFSWGC